jgi:hypothetical protein
VLELLQVAICKRKSVSTHLIRTIISKAPMTPPPHGAFSFLAYYLPLRCPHFSRWLTPSL